MERGSSSPDDEEPNAAYSPSIFWEEMEHLLKVPDVTDETQVNTALVKYIKHGSDSYQKCVKTEQGLYRLGVTFTESTMFHRNKMFVVSKFLSLLSVDLLECNLKFIISYIILCASKSDLSVLELLVEFQGFTVVYNNLYSTFAYLNRYGEDIAPSSSSGPRSDAGTEIESEIIESLKQVSTILMDILFQIFKYSKCDIANLSIVDDFFVYYLMRTMRSETTEDIFNNAKFKLLLALNEQYMIFSYQYELENRVYKYLVDSTVSKSFVELLLLKFNRVTDRSLQIMLCKIVYLILTMDESYAKDFFYLNDLHVLVDVLIRELNNIADDEELIRNTVLRVLFPLLRNTELAQTQYRRSDLIDILQHLSSLDNVCSSGETKDEHRTTVRLAQKCLKQIDWLQVPVVDTSDQTVPVYSDDSREMSVSTGSLSSPYDFQEKHLYGNYDASLSAESITKRLQPPPPPPARKHPHRLGSGQKIAQFRPKS